jgi:hypothetical protein
MPTIKGPIKINKDLDPRIIGELKKVGVVTPFDKGSKFDGGDVDGMVMKFDDGLYEVKDGELVKK